MTNIIDIKTGETIQTLENNQDGNISQNVTPEEILGIIGIQPQSKGNNLAGKLMLRSIHEHFQELHDWSMTARNRGEHLVFDDIDIAMVIIQKLESIPEKNYTENGLDARKSFLINSAIQIIAEFLGVKEIDTIKRREAVLSLYNRYAHSIHKTRNDSLSPDQIREQRAQKYNQQKNEA